MSGQSVWIWMNVIICHPLGLAAFAIFVGNMSKIITFSYLESFLEDCVKIKVVFQQIFRLFFSSFACFLFFPYRTKSYHSVSYTVYVFWCNISFDFVSYHIKIYCMVHIGSYLFKCVMSKKKLQYVTFYYIKKKNCIKFSSAW